MDAGEKVSGENPRFRALLRAGKEALAAGKRREAHDLWREAALLEPYNEKVWMALMRVLDTEEDRRVCLQNIIAINPLNVQARRQLNAYEARQERQAEDAAKKIMLLARAEQKKQVQRRRQTRRIRRWLLAAVFALLGGVLASIVVYGL